MVNIEKSSKNDTSNDHQPELNPVQTNALPINTSLQAANGHNEITESQIDAPDNDDGYDPSQLYPEINTVPAVPSSMPTSFLAISTLLVLLFIGQSLYLLRDTLAERGLRPLMQSLCASLNCELALPRAPNEIILKSREVRSHPNIKNALSVKATINNQASFRQAYPLLQIQFHDIKGRIIAGRDFLPQEYLPNDINIKKGILPNNPVNIALELIDPGKNAVSFLFIFK